MLAVLGLALAVRRGAGAYRAVSGRVCWSGCSRCRPIAAVALFAAGAPPWWQARAALAAAALSLVAALAVRRHRAD